MYPLGHRWVRKPVPGVFFYEVGNFYFQGGYFFGGYATSPMRYFISGILLDSGVPLSFSSPLA